MKLGVAEFSMGAGPRMWLNETVKWPARAMIMAMLEIRREDVIRLDPAALLILTGPIAIFLLGDLLFVRLGASQDIAFAGLDNWPSVQRAEASNRAFVLTGFLLVVAASATAAIVFVADFFRLFGPGGRRMLLIGFAPAVACILLSVGLLTGEDGFVPPMHEYFGGTFVAEVLRSAGPDAARGSGDLLDLLTGLLIAVQACLVVAVPAAILGAISCLAIPDSRLSEKVRRELRDLQRRRLQNYLRLSALMLTTGLLFMIAWMRWPVFG